MLTNYITSTSCLDNDGGTTPLQTFNQNPNLPPGITVGRVNNTDTFCLGDSADFEGAGQVCYSNIPGVHRALSNFNLNDYKKPDIDIDEVKKEEVPLTIEDMDKLVPGMWLKCLYDTDDTKLYEAMYLTSDANQMSPDVEGINTPNTIGIEYHRDELDKGDDAQKWVPISWCMPYGYNVYETTSNVEYMAEDNVKALFHRAFKELSNKRIVSSDDKVLFTYSQQGGTVAKDKDGYLKMGRDDLALPAEMDTSIYSTIYSALPFSHPAVQLVDDKFKLYQLYKDDPLASNVFPKSYSSYVDALQDTDEAGEDIFYIKDARATRGEDIYIKTRDELAQDYQELKEEGEYDVDEGEGDVIIQRAVTDLYTVDGEGPISGARFDIRYYVLIIDGKVYLHSTMVFSWPLGLKYNPNDTDVENQVIKSYFNTHDIIRTKSIEAPLKDEYGNKWNNSQRKRRRSSATSISSDEFRKADVHGWRDAVADALDDASGVLENLKKITRDDPTKYVLVGGDAMIKEDGSAVIIEFNVWSDMSVSVPYTSLDKCESGCTGLFIQTTDSTDNYIVTEPTAASHIISAHGNFEVVRDVVSMVMKVQPAGEIERWREIVVRDGD